MNEHEKTFVGDLRLKFNQTMVADLEGMIPEMLYHYTSSAGLLGIMESGKLWGTNYRYLNDDSEIRYGRKRVLEILDKRIKAEPTESTRSLLASVHGQLKADDATADFYLTCFCESPDLLSQWRGYGDASGRFCLGFDPDLFDSERATTARHYLYPVVYEQGEQERRIGNAIDSASETLLAGRGNNKPFRTAIGDSLFKKLLRELVFFKHEGFNEELEWRMVHIADNGTSVHFEAGLLKPCINMATGSSGPPIPGIKKIIIGRSRFDSLAQKSIDLLIRKYDYKDVTVKDSGIPFREL